MKFEFKNTYKHVIVYVNDKNELHRDNGAAYIEYIIDEYDNKKILTKLKWYKNGNLHNEIGPAIKKFTRYNNKDVIFLEEYYTNGKVNRINGPAMIRYRIDGTIMQENWFKDGKIHRKNGPAIIEYFGKKVSREQYYINGIKHRVDGPAYLEYSISNNKVRYCEYYLNGVRRKSEDIEPILCRIKDGTLINKINAYGVKRLKLIKIICEDMGLNDIVEKIDNKLLLEKLAK